MLTLSEADLLAVAALLLARNELDLLIWLLISDVRDE